MWTGEWWRSASAPSSSSTRLTACSTWASNPRSASLAGVCVCVSVSVCGCVHLCVGGGVESVCTAYVRATSVLLVLTACSTCASNPRLACLYCWLCLRCCCLFASFSSLHLSAPLPDLSGDPSHCLTLLALSDPSDCPEPRSPSQREPSGLLTPPLTLHSTPRCARARFAVEGLRGVLARTARHTTAGVCHGALLLAYGAAHHCLRLLVLRRPCAGARR